MAITAAQNDGVSLTADKVSYDLVETDVDIITSGRRRIPAHSGVLASASPVLTNIIKKPRKSHGESSKRVVKILGVPCDAVSIFVRFLYSPSLTEKEMENYGIHLLALSHVYIVPQLKQRCAKGVGERVTAENVVDVLQLARLCDAPDLCLKCMRLIHSKFKTVEQTEGWKFLQEHDPLLELDILQFIDEAESMKKRRRRHRREQNLYMQLSEAMECIEHICTDGCTLVGPSSNLDNNKSTSQVKTGPCSAFSTCYGLQLLIRHFAVCKKRVDGKGCLRCKRMIQLLRLHSSICDHSESCRVPLCSQFKNREEKNKKMVEDTKWKVLMRRVASAKAMSSLSQSKKKKSEVLFKEEAEDFIRIRKKIF
ncbi:BTB/POZ and TAZ domain-containing protein 1 [Hirschfeldia incana]|nr:BTB/POZ and TAZ domain-containing protein 1 [Hirschfeldia incana]